MNDSPNLGGYELFEVISALRKTVKLNLPEEAIYWANVILTHGGKGGPRLLARQLWIMAAEDTDDQAVVLRAFAVYQMVPTVSETDHLFYLVAQMCKATKWWETEEGRETDRLWAKAQGDLKDPARQHEIPHYSLDQHTRRGWKVKQQEGWFDDRFSGTWLGRAKTMYMFLRDGQIGPESRVECDRDGVEDRGFWSVWRERRRLQGDDLPDSPPDHEPEQVSLLDEGEEVESP
jgi:hypothetical protein